MGRRYISYFGIVRKVISSSGLGHMVVVFLLTFFVCSWLILYFDSSITNYGDAVWYCYQVVATIGFGNPMVNTAAGRVVTVVLSVISIFFLAILTGTVVNYTSEVLKARSDESTAEFIDKLEHLPELDKKELESISRYVKKIEREEGRSRHEQSSRHRRSKGKVSKEEQKHADKPKEVDNKTEQKN